MTTDDTIHNIFISARKAMARVVSRIVPPREIEDIVQETYVRLCQVEKKENITQPRSFLLKTARNLALDHIKRAEVRLVDGVDNIDEIPDLTTQDDAVYQQVANDQEFTQYCEAVRLLPVQCRKVFVLKKVYGYSQKEIAQQLNISESTVEKHVAMGIKRCIYYMMQVTRGENRENMNNAQSQHAQGDTRK